MFSTGIVLYQMLTGELPFTGDTLVSVGMKIAKTDPRALQEVVPDVPASVRRVIDRALKKAPEKRFSNGEDMARALHRCAEGAGRDRPCQGTGPPHSAGR